MPLHAPLVEEEFPVILAAAKLGAGWAVERLFVELQPRMLRFFRVNESREAEDLAAEVWASVATGITRFEGNLEGFRGWLFTIAHRRLSDHRRRAARRHRTVSATSDVVDLPSSDEPDVEALARLSGRTAAALVAEVLPENQADVVLLRVLGDLDVREVARIMDRSENWVRVTQHRALRRLAEHVAHVSSPNLAIC